MSLNVSIRAVVVGRSSTRNIYRQTTTSYSLTSSAHPAVSFCRRWLRVCLFQSYRKRKIRQTAYRCTWNTRKTSKRGEFSGFNATTLTIKTKRRYCTVMFRLPTRGVDGGCSFASVNDMWRNAGYSTRYLGTDEVAAECNMLSC
jgi:hypothetical protein